MSDYRESRVHGSRGKSHAEWKTGHGGSLSRQAVSTWGLRVVMRSHLPRRAGPHVAQRPRSSGPCVHALQWALPPSSGASRSPPLPTAQGPRGQGAGLCPSLMPRLLGPMVQGGGLGADSDLTVYIFLPRKSECEV